MDKLEIWKPVKDYEGFYEVSNIGRVRSLDRLVIGENGRRLLKGRILNPSKNSYGYNFVDLHKEGIKKMHLVHRLVAEAFIPNPDNKPCIDHISTIRNDNRVENLRWATVKENNNNPITKEKIKEKMKRPIIQYCVEDNQPIAWWNSLTECSKFTGISRQLITQNLIGLNKTVANKEFYFKYAK